VQKDNSSLVPYDIIDLQCLFILDIIDKLWIQNMMKTIKIQIELNFGISITDDLNTMNMLKQFGGLKQLFLSALPLISHIL
jgi:hypothetical protein